MGINHIENVENLIRKQIGNRKIIGSEITQLTAPGENYGGVLLKLLLLLKNEENDTKEEFDAVAKLIPSREFMQKIFNTQESFKKEIAFYDTVIPSLQRFQKEQGAHEIIDFCPQYYGSRINLNNSDTVDENAVIILENLKASGYTNINRVVGFDLETTKLILKDFAAFHAVPLAMRLKKPEVFEKTIKTYLRDLPPPPHPPQEGEHEGETPEEVISGVLNQSTTCTPFVDTLNEIIKNNRNGRPRLPSSGPFATMVHGDMWVNNIMVKFRNGKPVENKFVDFQNYRYNSCAADLFFFLWTSVQRPVLESDLDNLLEHYHKHFIKNLEDLKCDTTLYSLDNFLKEIAAIAQREICNALFMMVFVVFGKKGGFTFHEDPTKPPFMGGKDDVTVEAKEKVWYMIEECSRRKWLI